MSCPLSGRIHQGVNIGPSVDSLCVGDVRRFHAVRLQLSDMTRTLSKLSERTPGGASNAKTGTYVTPAPDRTYPK